MIIPEKIQKFGVPVRMQLANNSQILGLVFVRHGSRVMEKLCDANKFFAVKTSEGVKLVNKAHVIQVDLMTIEEIEASADMLPGVDLMYLRRNHW